MRLLLSFTMPTRMRTSNLPSNFTLKDAQSQQHGPPRWLLFDPSFIKGNASDEQKRQAEGRLRSIMGRDQSRFADSSVGHRLKILEVNITASSDGKREAALEFEIGVNEAMLSGWNVVHGACLSYLLDICSGLAPVVLTNTPLISKTINIVYHAPAILGTTLRVNTKSISMGRRTWSAQGEIWDAKNNRIIASGTHVLMTPIAAKL